MRSNSLAPRKPAPRPSLAEKPAPSTRPTTRHASVQAQMRKTNTRFVEVQYRPKKCPNCGSSFPPIQYNNHFRYCFRYREEENANRIMSKTNNKDQFRIKKVKGKKEEIAQKKEIEPQMKNQREDKKTIREKEEGEVEKVEKRQEFEIDDPEMQVRREATEVIVDHEGNEIRNVEDIQEIRHAIQEQEITRPTRPNNRPPTPHPMIWDLPQPNPRNRHILILPSDSQSSSVADLSVRGEAPQILVPPPPVVQPQAQLQQAASRIEQVIQGINIQQIIALVNRLAFLRQNPIVQERLRSLINFVEMVNIMIQTGGIPAGSFQTIRNVMEYLVGELTQILTIIVSARMGLVLLLAPGDQAPQNRGMTQEQIDEQFPPEIHNSTAETCTVCLNDFVKFERTITLKCKHEFHINCITEWLLKRVNCPVCRTDQK